MKKDGSIVFRQPWRPLVRTDTHACECVHAAAVICNARVLTPRRRLIRAAAQLHLHILRVDVSAETEVQGRLTASRRRTSPAMASVMAVLALVVLSCGVATVCKRVCRWVFEATARDHLDLQASNGRLCSSPSPFHGMQAQLTGPINPFPNSSERKLLADPALIKKVTGEQPEQVTG